MSALLSTSWRTADEIRRGASHVVGLTLSRSGAVVSITEATVRVLDETGAAVETGTAGLSGGSASFTMAGATTTDVDPSDRWMIEWTATTSYGTEVYRNPASVVLYSAAPVLTWDILLGAHSDLAERLATGDDLSTAKARAQTKQDEAWYSIVQGLRKKGRRACLVVDSYALLDAHKLATLRDIFRDLAGGGEPTTTPEWALYEAYKADFEAEWANLTFEEADPSTWDRTGIRRATRGGLWVGSSGAMPYRYTDGRRSFGGHSR